MHAVPRLQALHEETFGYVDQLDESSDPNSPNKAILDLWKRATVTVTTMLPAFPISVSETVNMTLLDAGQMVVVSSQVVVDVEVAQTRYSAYLPQPAWRHGNHSPAILIAHQPLVLACL